MSVFISYSRQDSDFVDLLQRLLVSKGYDTWLDRRDISAGSRWDSAIEQALSRRSHVIVVLTPEAVNSENVGDEWSFALEEGKTVIPVYYRACSVPMRLRRLQRVDFTNEDFALAFQKLIAELGTPDNRPSDAIELARREGLIFVQVQYPLDPERLRIAFVYSDYPQAKVLLGHVWFTLLSRVVERYTYGRDWILKDKITGQMCYPPDNIQAFNDVLLHEVGIEPGAQLEVVFIKEGM